MRWTSSSLFYELDLKLLLKRLDEIGSTRDEEWSDRQAFACTDDVTIIMSDEGKLHCAEMPSEDKRQ